MNTAVIGLGSMGYGIARSLLRAGHPTHGFDTRREPTAGFRAEGGATGEIAEVAPGLDAVVVVLNAAQTEAVLAGPGGILGRLRPGAVVVACATVAPNFARAMAARAAGGGAVPRRTDLGPRRSAGSFR